MKSKSTRNPRLIKYSVCLSGGWVYAGLLFWTLLSCSKNATTPPPIFTFNLARNEVQIFEVSQTDYALDDEPLTTKFFIKETVVDIQEKPNERTYVIERYRSENEVGPWQIERVYQLKQTPAELIEIGERPIVRLVFPVVENATFDVNRYNSSPESLATYKVGSQLFDASEGAFSVFQTNDSTLISLNRIVDVYTTTGGLIYKENTAVDYCQSSPECIGTGEIAFGKRIVWRRIE